MHEDISKEDLEEVDKEIQQRESEPAVRIMSSNLIQLK